MTNKNVSEPGNLAQVLIGSFKLLSKRPKLFIPKILSTIFGALWFIGIISGTGNPIYYIAGLPFLVFLGVAVSVVLAGMVKNQDSDRMLIEGLKTGRENLGSVMKASLGMLILTFVTSIPASAGVYLYLTTGELVFPAFLVGSTLLVTLGISFGIYFLPITLVEKGSLLKGLKSSKTAAFSNSKEVMTLTMLSFGLLALAFGTQGFMEKLGYIGFFAGRMVSAVVTTYLFVVSPEYYLKNN